MNSQLHTYTLSTDQQKLTEYVWQSQSHVAFNELIISWNAQRPQKGYYLIQVSVRLNKWTPWMDYAHWGAKTQWTYAYTVIEEKIEVYQDAIQLFEKEAKDFQVKVIACQGADLHAFFHLHVCTTHTHLNSCSKSSVTSSPFEILNITGLSQRQIAPPLGGRICSPTSTLAALRYLHSSLDVDLLTFANHVYDQRFDIFGNWVLNVAQAFHLLDASWKTFVCRTTFEKVSHSIQQGYPVVVSIKGPLEGSAIRYSQGHLVVVRGYCLQQQKIFCMDPAFADSNTTLVSYDLLDFLRAWKRRGQIAYFFIPTKAKVRL